MSDIIVLVDDNSLSSFQQDPSQELKIHDAVLTAIDEKRDEKRKIKKLVQAVLPLTPLASNDNNNSKSVKRKSSESVGNAAKVLKAKNLTVKSTKHIDSISCSRDTCDDTEDQVTSSSELLEENKVLNSSNRGKYLSLDKFFHRQPIEEVSTSGTKESAEISDAVCSSDIVLSHSNVTDVAEKLGSVLPHLSTKIVEESIKSKRETKKLENIVDALSKAKAKATTVKQSSGGGHININKANNTAEENMSNISLENNSDHRAHLHVVKQKQGSINKDTKDSVTKEPNKCDVYKVDENRRLSKSDVTGFGEGCSEEKKMHEEVSWNESHSIGLEEISNPESEEKQATNSLNSSKIEDDMDASFTKESDGDYSICESTPANTNSFISDTPNNSVTCETSMNSSLCETPKSSTVINNQGKAIQMSKKERDALRKQREEEKAKQKLELQMKKDEKERLKQEEKRKKEEARLKKEQEKMEKSKEKEEEKRKREEEKVKKEEEKRKKQEQLDAEKKKREEEKKKKEEEQLKVEEMKLRKQQAFQNFFIKGSKAAASKPPITAERFMAFELKANMKLAPTCRVQLDKLPGIMDRLDEAMNAQNSSELYIEELKRKHRIPGSFAGTWPVVIDDPTDVVIINENTPSKRWMKVKLFQFEENYRPPYRGTWRRKSSKICGRRPFAKDEVFDYSVDSDEEWEEEEPGESISHSEGEDDEEGGVAATGDDDDDDGFFVPHGYLSDGEGCDDDEDEEVSPEMQKARQLAKVRAWDAEREQKCVSLKPVTFGCCWTNGSNKLAESVLNKLLEFQMQFLCSVPIELRASTSLVNVETDGATPRLSHGVGAVKQEVPEEAYPDLIRLVHGNHSSVAKLIPEFKAFWQQKVNGNVTVTPAVECLVNATDEMTPSSIVKENTPPVEGSKNVELEKGFISKRQLSIVIRQIATYQKRPEYRKSCWYVKPEVLQKYSLNDLPIPTQWIWITLPKNPQVPENTSPISHTGAKDCAKKSGVKRVRQDFANTTTTAQSGAEAELLQPPKHPKLPPSSKGKIWRMLRDECGLKKTKHASKAVCSQQPLACSEQVGIVEADLTKTTGAIEKMECVSECVEANAVISVAKDLQEAVVEGSVTNRSPLGGLGNALNCEKKIVKTVNSDKSKSNKKPIKNIEINRSVKNALKQSTLGNNILKLTTPEINANVPSSQGVQAVMPLPAGGIIKSDNLLKSTTGAAIGSVGVSMSQEAALSCVTGATNITPIVIDDD